MVKSSISLAIVSIVPVIFPVAADLAGPVSVMQAGAKCDGDGRSADADTGAFEKIAASGRDIYVPANNYCILKRPITLHRSGQRVLGDDPASSKVLIYEVFGADGRGDFMKGVLNLEAPGQEVHGLTLSFAQTTSPRNRADLKTYQPAVRARQPATKLSDLLVVGATTCIDMGGGSNAGNSDLQNIDTGCYDYGIRLDGSLDTVHIRAHHSFPFQMTGAQAAVFERRDNIAIDLGRVDDYAIADSLCLGETCLNFRQGAQGGAFGTVHGYDFDGAAVGILMQTPNAALNGAGLTFSAGTSSQAAIVQTAGKIVISGFTMFLAAPTSMVQMTGGVLALGTGELNQGKSDSPVITTNCRSGANRPTVNGTSATPCRITLTGLTVERDPSVAFNNPWFQSKGSEIVVGSDNSVTPTAAKINGTVTPPAVSIAKDTPGNRWFGNSSPGWADLLDGSPMPDSINSQSSRGRYFAN